MSLVLDEPLETVVGALLRDADERILVIGPTVRSFETVIGITRETEHPPEVRVLAGRTTLKDATKDFLVAGHAADLVAEGRLEMRVVETPPGHGVVITPQQVASVVRAGERFAALGTDDGAFLEAARSFYGGAWERAEEFTLRTPPLSRVRETMRAEIGEAVATDFDATLTALGTARGEDDDLDEVTVSLLVAAKHRELLYDISKWGEDIGIASKATFSRTKTTLEERGVIDTEKVPIDVGRPRLRLKFADERLHDADGAELANVAQSVLG